MNRLLFYSCLVSVCAAILPVPGAGVSYGQNGIENQRGDASTLRDLSAAWAQRTGAIKSVTMTAEIAEVTKGIGELPPAPPGPFSIPRPKEDLASKVITEYAYEQGKVGLIRTSDGVIVPDEAGKTRPQVLRVTFDGEVNATLLEETDLPMGSIAKTKTAGPEVTVHVDFLAVGLWQQPIKVLQEVGWSVDTMSVEEKSMQIDGVRCRRVRIPRSTRRWASAIDVDPEKEYVPVQWQTWFDGKLSMKLKIQYGVDETAGPVVKAWEYTHNNEAGKTESIRRGRVTKYDINSDVDDSCFTIQFPIGTHVSERVGGKYLYFVQQADGLVPIKRSKYGTRL